MEYLNQPLLRTNWLRPGQLTSPQVPQNLLRPTWKGYGRLSGLGSCGPGSNCGCLTCGGGNVLTTALAGIGRRQLRRSALGQVTETDVLVATPRWLQIAWGLASIAGGALGAYHGYRRWDSIWGGIGWFFLGNLFWPIAIPVAFAQGFAQPRK